MKKRGQAALEFLMTYGWAILVVMVVIGALAYFGVLNPMIFVPDRCSMPSGFNCVTSVIDEGSARVLISNGLGQSIKITKVKFTYPRTEIECETTFGELYAHPVIEVVSGRQEIIEARCPSIFQSLEGRKLSFDIEIEYYLESAGQQFKTKVDGQVVTTVLSGENPAVNYNYWHLGESNQNCVVACENTNSNYVIEGKVVQNPSGPTDWPWLRCTDDFKFDNNEIMELLENEYLKCDSCMQGAIFLYAPAWISTFAHSDNVCVYRSENIDVDKDPGADARRLCYCSAS